MGKIDDVEAALAANWDREHLAVYGDALAASGDPRGELIAIDLHVETHGPSEELTARKQALIVAWLGAELAARMAKLGTIKHGFIEVTYPIAADEVERLLAGFAPAIRTIAIEDDDPGLCRAVDAICAARPPWLDDFHIIRYAGAFDEATVSSIAIDGDRARRFVEATPRLRAILAAGTNAIGELVHPNVREICLYDYNAIASLMIGGAPFPALTALDVQLFSTPSETELATLLPVARLPALRRLDLARNERHRDEVFELVSRHALVSQLAWLRVPSVQSDAHLDALERGVARMQHDAEVVVARAYAGCVTRSPSPRITLPPTWPWPPDGLRHNLAITVSGDPFPGVVELRDDVIKVLEVAFNGLAESPRAVWIELMQKVAELPEPRLFDDPTKSLQFSGDVLALALEPLDLAVKNPLAALRSTLRDRIGATLEFRRVW